MTLARITSQVAAAGGGQVSVADVERQLRTMRSKAQGTDSNIKPEESGFFNLLKEGMKEVNTTIKVSDQASLDMASGKSVNLHETMLAVSKAELALNLAVQMRNKMVEAYQDVMRMQV